MSTLNTTNLKNPGSGSNNIVLNTDGSTTIPTLSATTIQGTIKSGTAVASTSGTAIDFTGIPSWVKRVTVMFSGVSTNGSSNGLIQVGGGSFVTSGYLGGSNSTGTETLFTAGFGIRNMDAAAAVVHGAIQLLNVSGNTWVASGFTSRSNSAASGGTAGSVTLSGTLDRIRITTVNGTDTFDAGSVNILYEG
jgi:hypothetical protein